MKLSEFQSDYKSAGVELSKMVKADVFEIEEKEREYLLSCLDKFSARVRQADNLCRALSDEAPGALITQVTNVANINEATSKSESENKSAAPAGQATKPATKPATLKKDPPKATKVTK